MDPYKVLGVPETATDEEIKKAYRDLVKKYHPDRFRDNPMSNTAEEKIREINVAYDQIKEIRSGRIPAGYGTSAGSSGYSGNAGSSGYGYGQGYGQDYGYAGRSGAGTGKYSRVIYLIQYGYLSQAYMTLINFRESERDAQWYYLYGIVSDRLGRYQSAGNAYDRACRMEPENEVFRSARSDFERRAGSYTRSQQSPDSGDYYCASMSLCNICLNGCLSPLGASALCC